MKWMGVYLLGYVILICGVLAGLYKLGILHRIGPAWTVIGLVIAIGLGIMIAISGSGQKMTIDMDKH